MYTIECTLLRNVRSTMTVFHDNLGGLALMIKNTTFQHKYFKNVHFKIISHFLDTNLFLIEITVIEAIYDI